MAEDPKHPGYWLTQIRINPSQALLSGLELFILPDVDEINVAPADSMDQVVFAHFFAGTYNFWAAGVDWSSGIFIGYSLNRISGPVGRWGRVSEETLRHIRICMKVDGEIRQIPLSRSTHFHPQSLREALQSEIYG